MLCRVYTEAGQWVTDGACGVRRDGALELIPFRARRPLRPGEGPLLVAEGPRRYPVRVTAAHGPRDAPRAGADAPTVYHLLPIATS